MSATLRWWISVILLAVPLFMIHFWVSSDDKGNSKIEKKRFNKLSWLYFWIILFYLASAANVIHLVISYARDFGYDPFWFNQPVLVTWMVLALGMMFYPTLRLKNTILDGKKIDMREHLSVHKEVVFPWEYKPLATSLAILYFISSLIIVCIGAFFYARYRYMPPPRDVLLAVGIFIVGCFLCYLIFKPQTK